MLCASAQKIIEIKLRQMQFNLIFAFAAIRNMQSINDNYAEIIILQENEKAIARETEAELRSAYEIFAEKYVLELLSSLATGDDTKSRANNRIIVSRDRCT